MGAGSNGHAEAYATAAEVRELRNEYYAEKQVMRQDVGKLIVKMAEVHLMQTEARVADNELSGRIGNMSAAVFAQKGDIEEIRNENRQEFRELRRVLYEMAVKLGVKL